MKILYDYAMKHVGLPYRWGGDDSIEGFDCSGFIQELLLSCGAHPSPGNDLTAQELFNAFNTTGSWNQYSLGSLAFYGVSVTRITHVAMLLDQYRIIEAGGGGSKTLTKQDAISQNAFIRIRHVNARSDLKAVIKPNYAKIGFVGYSGV